MKIWPGKPYPLGATWDGAGVNMEVRCFGLRLAGDAIAELDDRGNRIADDTLLILLNAHHETIPFTLPAHRRKVRWEILLDTYDPIPDRKKRRQMRGGEVYDLRGRSIIVLQLPRSANGEEKRTHSRSAVRQIKGTVENRPLP